MKTLWANMKDLWDTLVESDFENIETPKEELETAYGAVISDIVPHAEPGAFQAVKSKAAGHGEQTVLPDDCEFGDNDLCYVET